jgi:hypothetical protein
VKTNKSDYIDAEAIAEAVARPTMRFVPIKTDDQLDMQSLHRVRERWVMRRTAVINQIRGLLLERGITLRKGRHHVDAALPLILEDADANLSGAVRLLLTPLKLDLDQLSVREGIPDVRQDSMELPQTSRETLCFSPALLTVRVAHWSFTRSKPTGHGFLTHDPCRGRRVPWLKTLLTSSPTTTWPRSQEKYRG